MKFLVLFALFAVAASQTAAPLDDEHKPGGLHKIEITDTRLVTVLAQAQKDLNAQMNSAYYYRAGKVIEAATQVVAGIMYHVSFEFGATKCLKNQVTATSNVAECTGFEQVQICQVRVLEQAWTDTFETSSFHCEAKPATPTGEHELPGGKHKLDVNDAALLKVLTEAETKINQHFNGGHMYQRITKVVEAESQVVNGVAYHVTLQLSQTQCDKAKITKETDVKTECNQLSQPLNCKAVIISQPWLNSTEVSQIECQSTKPVGTFFADTPVIAGGHNKMDVNDAELLKTLSEVTPQLNDKLESTYFHRIGKVLSAESQVVSGVMYHVSFELGQTQCLKSKVTKETNVAAECNAFSNVQVCQVKIWSQPWLHHTEVTEVHCEARKIDVLPPNDIRGPVISNP